MVNKKSASAETKPAAPKKKRLRLSAEKRKKQIIQAAQKVFVKLGLNGTRTRDLAKEAGVNEATLFLYFKTKQEIFDAAIVEPLGRLAAMQMSQGEAFSKATDESSKEAIGAQAHKEIYQYMETIGPLLSTALFSDDKTAKEIYKRDVYPMIEQFGEAANLSFGLKNNKEASEFVVIAALGLSFLMQTHHRLLGVKPDVDVITNRIANLFIHGVDSLE
ncbi:MAG: TetR/AcrR family transcriptional regulator [Gammaproteobacteria bacterium]|uniref:TetR/AcrR family transcriptional regulator n=1 Tax=Pseudomaricurvus alcaniphilus TaxID=1166482 RepID=UPI001408F22B|nr:TetR/AcrR family transcriptional regulator [Pseudomaricurvus alcaniphilus]MBR9908748.1 TetR/AcrR family transcriptional regulator [Gammaproteobacteria bacterium]NHN37844.1 TetR/AcrR family transcriptional regulator [Pseudomaricurvus alcaniphilus]